MHGDWIEHRYIFSKKKPVVENVREKSLWKLVLWFVIEFVLPCAFRTFVGRATEGSMVAPSLHPTSNNQTVCCGDYRSCFYRLDLYRRTIHHENDSSWSQERKLTSPRKPDSKRPLLWPTSNNQTVCCGDYRSCFYRLDLYRRTIHHENDSSQERKLTSPRKPDSKRPLLWPDHYP